MKIIEIKKSKIDSRGVFAAKDIKVGETIIKWHSKVISKGEFKNLSESDKNYAIKISDNKYYLMQSPEKYVNHSCEPNSKVENDSDIAIKDIPKGIEITSNYGDGDCLVAFKCNCGSKNCRGRILASE